MSRHSRHVISSIALGLCVLLAGCDASTGGHVKNSDMHEAAKDNTDLGQRYMQQGKLDVAMEKLLKALKYDPNYADAHTVIAVLYERIGNTAEAESHYRRATELTPKSGGASHNYGVFLCKAAKYDQAEQYFQRAIADPFYKTPALAYTNAGICMSKAGKHDVAEADFRKALELNPQSSESLFGLAQIQYDKADYFHARAFMQRFESLQQSGPDALLLGRNIESKLGNTQSAQEYAKRLRDEFPDSEQAHTPEISHPSS